MIKPGTLLKIRIFGVGTENFMFIERKEVRDRFTNSMKVQYNLLDSDGKINRIYSDYITILKIYE